MLEQKLIVGRYINLTLPKPVLPSYEDGAFVQVPVLNCYLERPWYKKAAGVKEGTGPKAHRNFKWLPWLPGAISEVSLVGSDVLTGPMSGCWLVAYKNAAGVLQAGHLGTDIASVKRTDAVNKAWNKFAKDNPARVVGGFNPLRHWTGAFPAKEKDEPATPPRIFGLFTTGGDYFILVAYQQSKPATMLRIAGIKKVQSSPLARLEHVETSEP